MTLSSRSPRPRGFSLIELMVTIAIIGIGLTLAVPYFGGATTVARERSVMDKMVQDFTWARVAAGVADASTLGTGLSGRPTVTMKLEAQATDCIWTIKVNGTVDTVHSMTQAKMAKLGPGITCGASTDTLTLPVTFVVDSLGMVNQSGTVTYSSTRAGSNQKFWPLLFLTSGAIINTNAVAP